MCLSVDVSRGVCHVQQVGKSWGFNLVQLFTKTFWQISPIIRTAIGSHTCGSVVACHAALFLLLGTGIALLFSYAIWPAVTCLFFCSMAWTQTATMLPNFQDLSSFYVMKILCEMTKIFVLNGHGSWQIFIRCRISFADCTE